MKTMKTLTKSALILTLVGQSFSISALAQTDAERIAARSAQAVAEHDMKVMMSLNSAREKLGQALLAVKAAGTSDYSLYFGGTQAILATGSAMLVANASFKNFQALRGGVFQGLQTVTTRTAMFAYLGTASGALLHFIDALKTKQVDEEQVQFWAAEATKELMALKSQVSGKDQAIVEDLIAAVAEAKTETTEQGRKQITKTILLISAVVTGAVTGVALEGVTPASAKKYSDKRQSIVMLGWVAASALSAVSGLTRENKNAVILKLEEAISAIDDAQTLVNR